MKTFDYFYGQEVEQFTFFRVPKLLITEPEFSGLSDSAKLMYGLFLDRTSLSRKNGWLDDRNRAYVIFSNEEIQEQLKCSKNTVTKVLSEIDTKKGIGLIERIRRGLGKPDIIYVKNFTSVLYRNDGFTKETADREESKRPETPVNKASVLNPKIWESRIPKFGIQESQNLGNSNPNNCDSEIPDLGTPFMSDTEINNIDSSKTDERERLRHSSPAVEPEETPLDDNPKMTSQVQERIRWLSQDDDVIPLTPREKKMFDLFILERKRRGKATSRVQRNTMIQNLHLYGHDEYVRLEILEKTIAKGWNDIYPLDRGAPGATNQEEGNSYGNGSI